MEWLWLDRGGGEVRRWSGCGLTGGGGRGQAVLAGHCGDLLARSAGELHRTCTTLLGLAQAKPSSILTFLLPLQSTMPPQPHSRSNTWRLACSSSSSSSSNQARQPAAAAAAMAAAPAAGPWQMERSWRLWLSWHLRGGWMQPSLL